MRYIAKKISGMCLLLSAFCISGMQPPCPPLDNNIAAHMIQDGSDQVCPIAPEGIIAAINTLMGVNPRRTVASLKASYGFKPPPEKNKVDLQDNRIKEAASTFLSRENAAALGYKRTDQFSEFQFASGTGDLKRVAQLLDLNVDIDEQSGGCTALHVATRNGRESIVDLLIERGVNVLLKDDRGGTALHFAAANYQTSIAQRLIKTNSLLVNAEDNEGDTPLHVAATNGNSQTVKLLLQNGAIMKRNKAGQDPLDAALESFKQMNNAHVQGEDFFAQSKPQQTLKLLKRALKNASE